MDTALVKNNNNTDDDCVEVREENGLAWGVCSWRPARLQVCNNIKFFTVCIGIFSLIQGLLVNGATMASIGSIEKEFGLTSKQAGVIVAGNDVSSLLLVGLISYFGAKANKPKLLSYGAFLTGAGSVLFALPKLLSGSYRPTSRSDGLPFDYCKISSGGSPVENCSEGGGGDLHTAIFFIAQLLMGAGTTPLYTLGPAYLDENVSPSMSPIYLGIFFGSTMLGPGLGFMSAGIFLNIFTDIKIPEGIKLTNRDHGWVGAWWLPYVSFAPLFLLSGMLLMCFPSEMTEAKKKRKKAMADGALRGEDESIEYSLKGLLRSTWKLIINKTYIFAVLALTFKSIYAAGMVSFFSKLLALKFGVAPHQAGFLIGVIIAPGMVFGVMGGSLLMKRIPVKDSAPKAALICFVVSLISLAASFNFAIDGCKNTNMAGVNVPYRNSTSIDSLAAPCNSNCSCNRAEYLPVCGADGITYFNPCYAGCQAMVPTSDGKLAFTNCKCFQTTDNSNQNDTLKKSIYLKTASVTNNSDHSAGHTAKRSWTSLPNGDGIPKNSATIGKCDRGCKNNIGFLVTIAVVVLISFITGTPHKMLVMRTVPDNMRSFALGVSFFLMRTLSYLPSPILVGTVIDSKCTLWGYDNCGQRLNCMDYDIDALSWNLVTFSVVASVTGSICYFISWRTSKPIVIDDRTMLNGEAEEML